MSELFTGRWLVREYVFDPDGTFAGTIQQRRRLEPQDDERLRVIQQMTVSADLDGHPMQHFAGEWVFDLVRRGAVREYHGVDVVGAGVSWGDDVLLGQGVWPRFGHNFTSFSILAAPQRQITGGRFYNAHTMIANIVGVAVPETTDAQGMYPQYADDYDPVQISDGWQAETNLYSANSGRLKMTAALTRTYNDDNHLTDHWENGQSLQLMLAAAADGRSLHVTGTLTLPGGTAQQTIYGKAKRCGWLLESTLYTPQGTRIESTEILDAHSQRLLVLRQWFQRNILHHVEVTRFGPGSLADTNTQSDE